MEQWQITNKDKLAEILANWTNCVSILKNVKINGKRAIDFSAKMDNYFNNKDFTFDNVDKQLRFTLNILGKIFVSKEAYFILDNLLGKLIGEITSLHTDVEEFHNFCQEFNNRDRSMEITIDDDMVITYRFNEDINPINLAQYFKTISDKIEKLLSVYSSIAYLIKKESSPNLTLYEKAWGEISEQIANTLNKIEGEYQSKKPLYEGIPELHEQAQKRNEAIGTLSIASKEYSDAIAVDKETIAAGKEEYDAFIPIFKDLQERVNIFNNEFNEFDTNISVRNEEYQKHNENREELDSKIKAIWEKLQGYEKDAGSILGKATVAGLARNFRARERDINKQLNLSYCIHVAVLVAFAAYAAFVFLWLGEAIKFDDLNFALLFFKLSLLLPALPILAFTNKRYRELFKLKEHYAYKDSIAASIPGFKKQSGEYSDLVATTFFSKLAFNPADDIGKVKGKNDDILDKNESLDKTIYNAIEEQAKKMNIRIPGDS